MRIAQVVTYISPDGAFGGPVRVALGQAEALAERGHEVTVYAAAPTNRPQTIEQDGYILRTFPARYVSKRLGFAGMRALGLPTALKQALPTTDVAHVHLARDLVTLPAVRVIRRAGTPFVLQTHGMIDRSTNPLAGIIDGWETRKALRAARTTFALTSEEERELTIIAPGSRVDRISNGVRVTTQPPYAGRPPLVLYLARLHPRKRPLVFVDMARALSRDFPDVQFLVAGPDEGEGPRLEAAIAASGLNGHLRWIGPVDPAQTDQLMRTARVYVLPSVNEVFPMTVLEALKAGTPTIVTNSLGISEACRSYGAAIVTDGSTEELCSAVREVLRNNTKASELRAGGLAYLRGELDVTQVAARLEATYASSKVTA